jgi:hypothetical protein
MTSSLLTLLLAASPTVAVLTSHGSTGELRFQPLDAKELVAPVASLQHAEGSPLLGSLLPGTRTVVATAVMADNGDVSFAAALFRLDEKQVRMLATQVVYGSRPLISSEGRVFVSRGTAGALTNAGRVDELTVDEVNPSTGKLRTVYSANGFLLFLVGSFGREVFIYELTPSSARLLAVHADTLGVRELIAQLPSNPRDFFVDAKGARVFFTHAAGDEWRVAELSVRTREWKDVAASADIALLPAVLADGTLTFNDGPHERFGKQGYERLVGNDFALHEVPGDFPSLYVRSTQRLLPISNVRIDVAGVLP